jgi:hypothetical protein
MAFWGQLQSVEYDYWCGEWPTIGLCHLKRVSTPLSPMPKIHCMMRERCRLWR